METLVALIVVFLLISTKAGFVYDVDKKTHSPELNLKWLFMIVAGVTIIWSICYHCFYGISSSESDSFNFDSGLEF